MFRNSRSRLLVIAVLVAVALSGCIGPTQFVHPTGSPEKFDTDRQACLYEAKLHQPQNPELWPDTVRTCLYTKGWKPVSKQYADRHWPYT